jgi:hypothetical protein
LSTTSRRSTASQSEANQKEHKQAEEPPQTSTGHSCLQSKAKNPKLLLSKGRNESRFSHQFRQCGSDCSLKVKARKGLKRGEVIQKSINAWQWNPISRDNLVQRWVINAHLHRLNAWFVVTKSSGLAKGVVLGSNNPYLSKSLT